MCRISRQDLLPKLEEAKARANESEAKVTELKGVLSALSAQFRKLADGAKALRDPVGATVAQSVNHPSAELLPQPLYFIFKQLAAAGEAYNLPVSVSISGASAFSDQLL